MVVVLGGEVVMRWDGWEGEGEVVVRWDGGIMWE